MTFTRAQMIEHGYPVAHKIGGLTSDGAPHDLP